MTSGVARQTFATLFTKSIASRTSLNWNSLLIAAPSSDQVGTSTQRVINATWRHLLGCGDLFLALQFVAGGYVPRISHQPAVNCCLVFLGRSRLGLFQYDLGAVRGFGHCLANRLLGGRANLPRRFHRPIGSR
jgi:hypothetical protein